MAIINITKEDMLPSYKAKDELRNYFSLLNNRNHKQTTFVIKTYGCQLNESDSEKLMGDLLSFGLVEAENELDADVIILNTCAIRENAEDRLFGNLGIFKENKRRNKDTFIAICGCMMKVDKNVERIKRSFPYVDLVFDPQQLHRFPELFLSSLSMRKTNIDISSDDYIVEDELLTIKRERKFRALVPIMYGCNNFCTYCIVPYSRGRERSRAFTSIVDELKALEQEGYKEIMLLGQNVNSYRDCSSKREFVDLLKEAAKLKGFSRIRFMSSHPKDISDDVIDIMASEPNLETHLHLPLQSGSNDILKAMNRPYSREQYLRIAERFRKLVPEGAISTDIIVGFPGETEKDFEDTLDVINEVKFDSAFTFQYSPRPGTKAASMENQIPHDIVSSRFGRLLELQNDYAFKSNQSKVGKTEEVLIEGISSTSGDIFTGRTRSNHLINFTVDDSLKGTDLEGKLGLVSMLRAKPYSVEGELKEILL